MTTCSNLGALVGVCPVAKPRLPKPKLPAPTTVERCLDTLLEGHYPPPAGLVEHGLHKVYARRQDDTDGKRTPD